MIEFDEEDREVFEDLPRQVNELKRVFESIRTVIEQLILTAPEIDGATPQAIITKLSELQSVHLEIVAAEEAFHAENGPVERPDDIDLSSIRAEIGGHLDRLRAAINANKIPFDTDP